MTSRRWREWHWRKASMHAGCRPVWGLFLLLATLPACDDARVTVDAVTDAGRLRDARPAMEPDARAAEPRRDADTPEAMDAEIRPIDASVPADATAPVRRDGAPADSGPMVSPDAARPGDQFVAPEPVPDAGPMEAPQTAQRCFAEISSPDGPNPDYDQFDPVVGRHCAGTNHQDIRDVEQVVFLGDSVTNGTPDDAHPLCLDNDHLFRVRLANWLAERFDLSKGEPLEWEQWEAYSCLYNGDPGLTRSGDFANCARWGGDNEELLRYVSPRDAPEDEREAFCRDCCAGGDCGGRRCIRAAGSPETDARCGFSDRSTLRECVPESVTEARTLFVFTLGGNDVANMTQAGGEFTRETEEGRAEIEAGYPSVRAMAQESLIQLEEAIRFMTDPARFPNGSYVVVGGPFEFTDGTGLVDQCQPQGIEIPGIGSIDLSWLTLDVAALVGFQRWADPVALRRIITEFVEGYMRIVVTYGVDYVWVMEHFCGHGYVAAGAEPDMDNPCYRPDDPTLWFDASCTHPNDAGHEALFRLFRDVIAE